MVCCLQPFLGSGEASNRITGKIKLGTETLCTLEGHWDQDIYIKDKRTGVGYSTLPWPGRASGNTTLQCSGSYTLSFLAFLEPSLKTFEI